MTARVLRLGLAAFSIYILSGIIPISATHFHTGDACPTLGPIPACYIVAICYSAMGVAAIFWNKRLSWLFFAGVTPVILLASVGSFMELTGDPTCPQSESGFPLCYISWVVGVLMLVVFLIVRRGEKNVVRQTVD